MKKGSNRPSYPQNKPATTGKKSGKGRSNNTSKSFKRGR